MATYAISDIHGALDEFEILLKRVGFRYDGSDELYLLGDYVDWGKKSMEALLYIMDLDRKYPFVHCIMGNHELMFLSTILSGYSGREEEEDEGIRNWLHANKGEVTWKAYSELSGKKKKEIEEWLKNLRLSFDVEVNGKLYMLAHAYPYFYDEKYGRTEQLEKRADAVWRRLMLREDPFAGYSGSKRYDKLICGHTITDYYFGLLRYEKNWPYKKPSETVRNRVFRGEKFIDIDCGAKCLDLQSNTHDFIQIAALRAQLACLRLEDEKASYVHRLHIQIPEMHIPEMHISDLAGRLNSILHTGGGEKNEDGKIAVGCSHARRRDYDAERSGSVQSGGYGSADTFYRKNDQE